MKCGCCGSEKLVVRRLSDGAQFGGIRVDLNGTKFARVDRARVCTLCGTVMPCIDCKLLSEEIVSLD